MLHINVANDGLYGTQVLAFDENDPLIKCAVDEWLNTTGLDFMASLPPATGVTPLYEPGYAEVYFTGEIGFGLEQPFDVLALYQWQTCSSLGENGWVLNQCIRRSNQTPVGDLALKKFIISTYVTLQDWDETRILLPRKFIQVDMMPWMAEELQPDSLSPNAMGGRTSFHSFL